MGEHAGRAGNRKKRGRKLPAVFRAVKTQQKVFAPMDSKGLLFRQVVNLESRMGPFE
jgi:hypothetical protein